MKRMMMTLSALALAALLPAAVSAQNLTADLAGFSGGAEGGSGYAVLTINGTDISSTILTQAVDNPTAAHIHRAADDSMLIDLGVTFAGALGTGTVSADASALAEVVANPAGFYVQVHSQAFPSGAIRGALRSVASGGGAVTLYFPVAASIQGQAGTFFKTDGRFVNRSGQIATLTIDYYAEGAAGNAAPTATTSATIAPNQELAVDDAVNTLFGVSNGKGAMVVASDAGISGDMRIYNDQTVAGLGTFGQFVRGLPMTAASASGVLPFLSNEQAGSGTGFRSNIGWFNPSATAQTVTLRGWDADGTLLGEVTRTVNGFAQEQYNVSALWSALATYGNFYVTYESTGAVFMYASVVDNVNGDAVYVPASPLG